MKFKRYQHIERFGTDEVQGIELGITYIFPKIDGTNGSLWLNNEGILCAGSRNRELSLEKDNAGFLDYIVNKSNSKFVNYLLKHPNHRLYGEWLVPHSLKTYRDDAWRRFYIFDVCLDKEDGSVEYIPYYIYKPMLNEFEIDYIPPIAIIRNGSYEYFINYLEKNNFLIEDGKGHGEGIVIKNYDFYNRYRRQVWAKIVANEFKEKHHKEMGAPLVEAEKMIEEKIIDEFCTESFINKEFSKIVNEMGGWKSKYIPMLFNRVFSELIKEEMWNIIGKFKNPTINFKTLNALMINKIKAVKEEIF